jgi:hypothetical protein
MMAQRIDQETASNDSRICRRALKQITAILLRTQTDTNRAANLLARQHPHLLPILFPEGIDHG